MIRGFVAVINSDSPLPDIPTATSLYRKAALKLSTGEMDGGTNIGFNITVEGTGRSFQVVRNIILLDKDCIDSGLVRIKFIQPRLDVVIYCNTEDLKTFVYTVEVLKSLQALPIDMQRDYTVWCGRRNCSGSENFSHSSVSCGEYAACRYQGSYLRSSIPNNWLLELAIPGRLTGTCGISVASFPYLRTVNARSCGLREIAESLGSLPCLIRLNLSGNRLGEATNWNCFTSPFIKENLVELRLDGNNLTSFPEAILGLQNLQILSLNENSLTECPVTLRKLEHLRYVHIIENKLRSLYFPLGIDKNLFCEIEPGVHYSDYVLNYKARLSRTDFETTQSSAEPSLFKTVASFIISKRIPYWEYNIPAKLADFLDEAYLCHCGSIVFSGKVGRLVYLRECEISDIHTAIHCCSYECYSQLKSDYCSIRKVSIPNTYITPHILLNSDGNGMKYILI